jgi:hypothetical protein
MGRGGYQIMIRRFKLIKLIKEYKDIIAKCKDDDYVINYENMVLNLIDIIEA